MIQIRQAGQRGAADYGWLKSNHTFSYAGYRDGNRVANPQVTRRKWKDGKVVHERFYHA